MFNVIRIPTKFSKTIRRLSDKEKLLLLEMLINIGDGKETICPDNQAGDVLSLIYGEWMNMESRNGNKPVSSLLSELPGTVLPSDPEHRVEYNRVEYSIIEDNKINILSNDNIQQAVVVSEEKKEYGNKDINTTLTYIKKIVGCTTFKESEQIQRRYGKHLFELGKKIGLEEFNFRLKTILEDGFKAKNCNKLSYLYGELKSFIHTPIVEVEDKSRPRFLSV